MTTRVERLAFKDVSWDLLYVLYERCPRNSAIRLWMSLMLFNPPMRDEAKKLTYKKSTDGSRGFITADEIVLTHTKMTTRTKALQHIPMSIKAIEELNSYVEAKGIKSGQFIFERGVLDVPREIAKVVNDGSYKDFTWLSANTIRRVFCREILPLVWATWGYVAMERVNALSGHGMDVVKAYSSKPRKVLHVDSMLLTKYGITTPSKSFMYDIAQGIVNSSE